MNVQEIVEVTTEEVFIFFFIFFTFSFLFL